MSIEQIIDVQIKEELSDEEFTNRTHGTPSCYNAGCRGELCKLARRLEYRNKQSRPRPMTAYDTYVMILLETHQLERGYSAEKETA